MDKQQAAEAHSANRYGESQNPADTIYGHYKDGVHDFIAGWEAHEAQQSEKTVETLCPACNGDGFIEVDTRQSDGTYQIDCEFCETKGKHVTSVPSAPPAAGPVLTKELFNELIIAGRDMETRDRLGNVYLPPDDYYKQICERTAPAQQVFTREQVEQAHLDGYEKGISGMPGELQKYMNHHYPVSGDRG
jgi:hypothetical protein